MDEIYLHFLKSPPRQSEEQQANTFISNETDIGFVKKKHISKRFRMSQSIAKVDELVRENDGMKNQYNELQQENSRLKIQNNELQQELKDFQLTAQQVQQLYSKEKQEHEKASQDLDKLQKEYDKIDLDLTNKTMVNEQIMAQLSEYESRPISFDNLVVKYVKIVNKMEDDKIRYSIDKDLIEKLREYCALMKLKIPLINSPKKPRSRGNKIKLQDTFVQCNLFKESINKNQQQNCVTYNQKHEMLDQSTQTFILKCDQASQYISTMITRQTNTEKVVRKDCTTMFPEPQKIPAIYDILNVYSRWSNIRSVSPLQESPERSLSTSIKSFLTVGTCTMLCNIRRKIDYLPSNTSTNIKQEIITPSVSPTPNFHSITTNRARESCHSGNVSSNINSSQFNSAILNLFNTNTNSALGQLSSSAFNELWQMFGKMLLSLLQTSKTDITNPNQSSAINQQQFLDWLLNLYISSQPQAPTANHTQTIEPIDCIGSKSPLCFNNSSSEFSTNVMRPQAQKKLPLTSNIEENKIAENVKENADTVEKTTSTQDFNSINKAEHMANINEGNQENIYKNTKSKRKHKLMDKIKEIIPELNLSKKKRKALKRLINKNNSKKSFKSETIQKSENLLRDSAVVLTTTTNNNDTIETAVDFLKTFAASHEKFSETETIFLEPNFIEETSEYKTNEFTFDKPNSSSRVTGRDTFTNKLNKCKKSRTLKNKTNKYQILFGDSDSEGEELANEVQNSKQFSKPVNTMSTNLCQTISQCNVNESTSLIHNSTQFQHSQCSDSFKIITPNNEDETYQVTQKDAYQQDKQQEILLPFLSKSVFKNTYETNTTRKISLIPDVPRAILTGLGSDNFECANNNGQTIESNSVCYKNSEENDIMKNDLELSSDDSTEKEEDTNIILQTENNISNDYITTKQVEKLSKEKSFDLESLDQTKTIELETTCFNHKSLEKNNKFIPNSKKCSKNYTNINKETQHEYLHTTPTYTSNFENDLDISSDNESLINESDYNVSQQFYLQSNKESALDEPCFRGNLNTLNSKDDSTSVEISEIEFESLKSIQTFETNCSKSESNFIESGSENESYPYARSENTTFVKSNSISQDPNSSVYLNNLSEKISKNFENKEDTLNQQVFTKQSNTKSDSTISSSCSLSITNNINCMTKDFKENETITQNKTEKNSLCWSVITITDSSTNDKTYDNKEIIKTPIEEGIEDVSKPKSNSLSSLKLLNLNDTSTHVRESNKGFKNFKNDNRIINTSEDKFKEQKDDRVQLTICSTPNEKNAIRKKQNPIRGVPVYKRELHTSHENDKSVLYKHLDSNELMNTEDKNDVNSSLYLENELISNEIFHETNSKNKSKILEINKVIGNRIDPINRTFSALNELNFQKLPKANENSDDTINSKTSDSEELDSSILSESNENPNEPTNSSYISTLLNSTLYNEIVSESLEPIVNDLFQGEKLSTDNKPKKSRKRRSECLAEVLPCKRSQRIKAKQMILEQSLNLSNTPIELGKYTKSRRNVNNLTTKSPLKENTKKKALKTQYEATKSSKTKESDKCLQMGFFKETLIENSKKDEEEEEKEKLKNSKVFTKIIEQQPSQQHEKYEYKNLIILQENFNDIVDDMNKSYATEGSESFVYKNLPQSAQFLEEANELNKSDPYKDSPHSPPPLTCQNDTNSGSPIIIPLERPSQFIPKQNNLTLFDGLINSYKPENHRYKLETVYIKEKQQQENILAQCNTQLKLYCYSKMDLDPNCTSVRLINKLLSISTDYTLLQNALIIIAQNAKGTNVPEDELPSIIQEMPPRHLSKCLQRLYAVLSNLVSRNNNFCHDLIIRIESLIFDRHQSETLNLQAILNLTQLYLMACRVQEYVNMPRHPARLFITKCLYCYPHKSTLLIHEVLMWYPTVLPHREDKTYDRSDALISVLQQILMNTKYDMSNPHLRGKTLLSKLRYEYHFEPFKPTADEVINVLVEKLKNCKFYNISMAFVLLCKRLGVERTKEVLTQHLLPLANEYYSVALKTDAYDKRIEVLLEIISMIVKLFPIDLDTNLYLNEFARFLNGFERQLIQEAAVCSILRLQRFDVKYCFNLLRQFQPTYNLNSHTQAMFKTFLYRRPLSFWKSLKLQNPI